MPVPLILHQKLGVYGDAGTEVEVKVIRSMIEALASSTRIAKGSVEESLRRNTRLPLPSPMQPRARRRLSTVA